MNRTIAIALYLVLACFKQASAQDTLFTSDPSSPGVMYMDVHNKDGVVITSGRLLNGKMEGVFRWYNDKNSIKTVREYHKDILDGVALEFGDNGAIEAEENYRNGLLSGKRIIYRFGGLKKSIEFYSNGKLNGVKTVYYENGFKQEEGEFKDGLREGVTKWYNQSEQLNIEFTYKKGILEGPATTYFPQTGKPELTGVHKNGNEEGEWKKYDVSGKQIESVFYENGKEVKVVKY